MSERDQPTAGPATAPPATTYAEVRQAGRNLISKIHAHPLSRVYSIMKAAKKLTLPVVDNTLVFDGETDMNALADFWIHEFRLRGQTLIAQCRPNDMGLTPLEAEVLRAHQQTRTSLFEVREVSRREHQIRLGDLLEPAQPEVCLTDHGLSGSLGVQGPLQLLLFFRVVNVAGYQVTSGVSFVFRLERKAALLHAYRERMARVEPPDWAERKYVFFYRKHRDCGEEQAYAELPGTT